MEENLTGTFGAPDENGRRVEDLCAERGLCVSNMYCKKNYI